VKRSLYCLVGILALLLPFRAQAQRYYSPDFSVGVRAGATLSQMAWSPSVIQKFTPGVTLGLVARYTEENYFGVIGELNLTQRGWAESFDKETGLEYKRQFTYVQLPVMTHIFFGSKKFRFFVNLGPEIGVMVGDKIKANFDYGDIGSVAKFPANHRSEQLNMEVAHRIDYGIAGGLGCEARIKGKHSFMIEGRFYYGIGNVFSSNRGDTFGASRGMSIEVTAAYLFRLK